MGFAFSDLTYDRLKMDHAGMTKLPPSILRTIQKSEGEPSKELELLAAANGWNTLRYKSMIVRNPPHGSTNRFVMLIEGAAFDQIIQFTTPRSEDGETEQLIDFIALQKTDSTGNVLAQPRIHFRQFLRDEDGKWPKPRVQKEPDTLDRCYGCHGSGVRKIQPVKGSADPAKLMKFNSLLSSYGLPDYADTIHIDDHGPTIGNSETTAPPLSFFKDCVNPGASIARVQENMNCVSCHDGALKGKINLATSTQHIWHKIVKERSMPPGADLSDDERQSLYKCLLKDQRERFKSWLSN